MCSIQGSIAGDSIKLSIVRVLLLKQYSYDMINMDREQQTANDIRQKTWQIFRQKYKKKYNKPWKDEKFTVVASINLVNKQEKVQKIVSIVSFGTKSLPQSIINQQNRCQLLFDMHAQILAIQGFKRFVLRDISKTQQYFFWEEKKQKFKLKDEWQVWLYCSQPFCGDCCINQKQQSFSGAKPLKYLKDSQYPQSKYQPGILRTKPGRLDLPVHKRSAILSCSDKLAFFNLVGIQGRSLFSQIFPIYISVVVVQTQIALKQDITRGLDFVRRLRKILNRPESLIQRQLFNVVIKDKQKKVSNQFKRNQPKVIVLKRKEKEKMSRDNQGFEMCGIFCQNQDQWINGKTGLPQGSSIKNYQTKGKISMFSAEKLKIDFQNNRQSENSFKWEAVERRSKLLWGQWLDVE